MAAARASACLLAVLLAVGAAGPAASSSVEQVLSRAREINDFIVKTRRTLHSMPEPSGNEWKTSAEVKRVLKELGVPFT